VVNVAVNGNGLWMVGANSSDLGLALQKSYDGINWAAVSAGSKNVLGTACNVVGLAYSDAYRVWLASGYSDNSVANSFLVSSVNGGNTWLDVSGNMIGGGPVTWNGAQFLVGCSNYSGDTVYAISSNGYSSWNNWSLKNLGGYGNIIGIACRNEICVFCLENVYNSQYSFLALKCNHIVHNICLEKGIESSIYKCPSCRKSIYNIDWNSLRESIVLQPLPLPDICIGDQLKTTFLGNNIFNIDDIINNSGILTYKVSLVNNPYFIGFFNKESLIKNLKKVDILCNDCENKSNTIFHYLGNECSYCNSFNTLII
jgi:hypothetical protein